MTPKMLASYSKILWLKRQLWTALAEGACWVAQRFYSNARTAEGAASITASRALGDQRLLHPSNYREDL